MMELIYVALLVGVSAIVTIAAICLVSIADMKEEDGEQ